MNADEIKKLDGMHIVHPWSVNSAVDSKVIEDVDGVYMIDSEGKRILDFSSQLICVNAGHKNPRIIKAIQEQAERICYVHTGYACEPRSKLGKMLAEVTPGDLNRFFFTTGGLKFFEHDMNCSFNITIGRQICQAGVRNGDKIISGFP